ncbi:MAG: AmmeMemoRadiSam system protein B [Myxococcales bacterium]|nr:AmmeMemoRadiSam system protein B [Myxococcales bacterium]
MPTRLPAVAGQFYPARAEDCTALIERCFAERIRREVPPPKAVIVPHAGWVYSGPIAATAYASLLPLRGHVTRVVLLGPSHRFALRGWALPEADTWRTPLGDLPIDTAGVDVLANRPGVVRSDAVHAQEHSLEVHLPFLQHVLGSFRLLPVAVGDLPASTCADLLGAVWGGSETLIVVSSDLSHYHTAAEARRRDAGTTAQVEALDPAIDGEQACGCRPLAGLLVAARARGLQARAIDVRNSSETAGDALRVVGYGSYLLWPAGTSGIPALGSSGQTSTPAVDGPRFMPSQRRKLTGLALAAIRQGLTSRGLATAGARHGVPDDAGSSDAWLREPAATFVTVEVDGELHGCIGNLSPQMPLSESVAHNAHAAAFHDPRSHALTAAEFARATFKVSVLSPLRPLAVVDRADLERMLRPGIDGVVIRSGRCSGTFLPIVWEVLPEPRAFVTALWRKAGLPAGSWPADLEVLVYGSEAWDDEGEIERAP